MKAGRVDEDDLARLRGEDAADPVARGLGNGRDDGHLAAAQGVDERRLARGGTADDGDDGGFHAFTRGTAGAPRRRRR